jgi:hypothetical protein
LILIYSDSDILDREWIPSVFFPEPAEICHSFVEYQASPAQTKIAFTTHRLHCDHDINCTAYQGFEDKINKLSECSNLVFTFESELHNYHWQMWQRCHHDNVYWVLPGAVNDRDDINSHIVFWGDWFKTTTLVYKALPHKLYQLQPYTTKPRMFDALLGVIKPHRTFVYEAVHNNNLLDKFVMTYGGTWKDTEFYAQDYFVWEPDCVPVNKIIGTADWVDYCGVRTGLSRVIPINTFNDTAYSIIAETDHDNTLSFFSEKTAKPMIARRLFVAFSGYKFLHNLRAQGFRTFDGVIDESYDLILDDTERYTAAFEQVKQLCLRDQQQVYDQIRDTVEHNYNHIMCTNWTQQAADQITRLINSAQRR